MRRPVLGPPSAALLGGAVLSLCAGLVIVPASAAPKPDGSGLLPAAAPENPCASIMHPRAARTLGNAIRAALYDRAGTESVAVYDRRRNIHCGIGSGRHYDSASVVKATILGALLYQVTDENRRMTATERSRAHKMITRSDNAAATALWRSVGRTRMQRFLRRSGMVNTRLGPDRHWGLTQITAHDEMVLLRRYTAHNTLLTDKARTYALELMHDVLPSQRWGTPAGRPGGIGWHVKNGWLARQGKHWRVHSIGSFEGRGEDYMIVVLTQDTPSMRYGVETIERVSRAVHRRFASDGRSMISESVPEGVWEVSDGSVPADV